MLFCYFIKCGEWPYLFATIVANTKILLDIAALDQQKELKASFTFYSVDIGSGDGIGVQLVDI